MKIFKFSKDNENKNIIFKAESKKDIKNIATSRNYGILTKLGESKDDKLSQNLKFYAKEFFGNYFNAIKMPIIISSFRELAVMVGGGISLHEAIKHLLKSTKDKKMHTILSHASEELNQGKMLSASLQTFRQELGDISLAMIKLGENTGDMKNSLEKLVHILSNIYTNKQKFKKALRYPLFIITFIIIAFLIIITVVVPKFKEVFESLGADLPLPTRLLLGAENFISRYGFYAFVAIVLLMILTRFKYKNDKEVKLSIDNFLLKIYLIKNIIFNSEMARFMLILTELIKAGIPVSNAIDTAVDTLTNESLRKKLSTVSALIGQGVSLSQSFNNTKLIEPMLISMIDAGEQSGSLDNMLGNVSEYYERKFDDILDNLSAYIEPILLLFLGLIITILALGIFMPMWDLSQAVRG
ncbi:MAG: type II secretion system F family protein [Campylobacter sp.]|nr:type II secretion system F family protein [Campylobacter sp.]